MMGKSSEGRFRLGNLLVDPRSNRVRGPDGETALQPIVMDVLCALTERHGEVVSRAELIDTVWGRAHGADESLTRAISLLRKVFGESRDMPGVIETIPKRGYRLRVAPEPEGDEAVPDPRPRRARRTPRLVAIIVLLIAGMAAWLWFIEAGRRPAGQAERTGIVVTVEPFASSDPVYSPRGFADELAADLARSPLVRVRTRDGPVEAGALHYRLRGEIRRDGARTEIASQLIDAASNEVVWGERFDRAAVGDAAARAEAIGAIDGEMMLPLLRSAKAKLAARPANVLAPWEAVLLVTWVPGAEGRLPAGPPSEESYWLQKHALGIDADFAPAHALFAELASYHALFHPPLDTPAARERAERHAELALELAPYDAEVLYQVALHYQFAGDRQRAVSLYDRVIALQPNHPLAQINRDFVAGQCQPGSDEAVARLEVRVAALPDSSPRRWVALAHLSALRLARGEFAEARRTALASRQIVPMTWTSITLAAADAELGLRDEAVAALAGEKREWPDLDAATFADRAVMRWCLGGSRASAVRESFRRLAAMLAKRG